MITLHEDEAHDPVRSYGKGYVGTTMLPDNYCRCPEPADQPIQLLPCPPAV